MPAPDTIHQLCETFAAHLDHYKSAGYNETELRREFLDPFWDALGWDMNNKQGYADAYKDVVHEDAIKVGGRTKAPDYCFRIGGTRKFFLEAKKPGIAIKTDTSPAYQLRRYAWSAKLPLSVLSDFEELAVYDCRVRPKSSDPASTARTLYLTFDQYPDRWEEIESIFSRQAILKGSFDKYAETTSRKRGTAEVDDAFLGEIENWRNLIARNLVLRNEGLTVRDLNYAVQKIIDRIIFLRICEDRGTEDYGRLAALQTGPDAYSRLLELFDHADERYNSGLFHFRNESGHFGSPDTLTPNLAIDDSTVKEIVRHLYYPDSPYEFSVLPSDILGQVYERFLGRTLTVSGSKRKRITIEEKPEVRKAGGVYYTPSYIVEYIVDATLGPLLNGNSKSKRPISVAKAATISVLDPACGSGSFLIAAYQYLIEWHRDQYTIDPPTGDLDRGKISRHSTGTAPKIYQSRGGEWRLTTSERKRILLNSIFGVDIDPQAVEVTKLSLLLKVLEGETSEIVERDWIKERERILPDLGSNILCGNSLISTDLYDQLELLDLDDDTRYRINAFEWKAAFPKILDEGGFDCVIGNPPWGASFTQAELSYLRVRYSNVIVRMIDSFMFFLYLALNKLKAGGTLGMILPDVVLYQRDNSKVRKLLIEDCKLSIAVNAGKVFEQVTRPAAVIVAKRESPAPSSRIRVANTSRASFHRKASLFKAGLDYAAISTSSVLALPDLRIPTEYVDYYPLVAKLLQTEGRRLQDFLDSDGIQRGVSPDLKEAFIVNEEVVRDYAFEREFLKPTVTGGAQIRRYGRIKNDLQVIYTTRTTDLSCCPNICSYIERFADQITCKEVLTGKHSRYSLHRARSASIFEKDEKLIGVITEDQIALHLDSEHLYPTDGLYLFSTTGGRNLRFLMGILNSKLLVFLYRLLAIEGGRVLAQVKPTLISEFPIPDINKPEATKSHDAMESLVDRMISLNSRARLEANPETLRHIQNEIVTVDRNIDRIVYELYGLSEEEIGFVENSPVVNG